MRVEHNVVGLEETFGKRLYGDWRRVNLQCYMHFITR